MSPEKWWRRASSWVPAARPDPRGELRGLTPGGEEVLLRALAVGDEERYHDVRARNADWLERWDATDPTGSAPPRTFAQLVEQYDEEARQGRGLAYAVVVGGALVGQVNLSTIVLGAFRSGSVGYWIGEEWAGRGIMPTAVALVCDHAFGPLGLHRVEINVRPENAASLAVVRKLGFRDEGLRERMLHIDGDWRDHRSFALTVEETLGVSVLEAFRTSHSSHFGDTPGFLTGS